MSAGRQRPAKRRDGPGEDLAQIAHDLRATLSGIRTWAHVLRARLSDAPDPTVQRALDGIATSVEQQVRLLESLEGKAAQPPSGASSTKNRGQTRV